MMDNLNNKSVSTFLSYLQKRMDFIAQVATSPPSWCMVTDCDRMIQRFNHQICLVKNIIRSHQGDREGPDFEPVFEQPPRGKEERSLLLDIPHGQVGVQAFYIILENIVRNTAKYGNEEGLKEIKDARTGKGKLTFTIDVRDQWEDDDRNWAKDFRQVRIVEQLRTHDSPTAEHGVAASLNSFLSEPLTDPVTGVVMPKHWGMKEIKICAAYLRMVKQEQIDESFERWKGGDSDQPPIIRASLEKVERSGSRASGHLTYTLYLLRPKEALVVLDPPEAGDAFRRAGVDFYAMGEFRRKIEQGWRPRHSFLVLPRPSGPDDWQWLAANLNSLPPRVVVLDSAREEIPAGRAQLIRSLAFMQTPLFHSPAQMMSMIREAWVQTWWGEFKIFVRWSRHPSTVAENKEVKTDKEGDVLAEERSPLLVFDHHPASDTTALFRRAAYHEALDSHSPLANLLLKSSTILRGSEELGPALLERERRHRIKETAGMSVAVIDERVWLEKDGPAERGVRKYAAPRSRHDVWARRRVFLQDTNEALRDFGRFAQSLVPTHVEIFDFVIIHQGIIDAVRDKMTTKAFEDAWLGLRAKARWLVVDSGRGQPEKARESNLRWVEYSNLAECLIQEAGDKFKLAELLWTLRASSGSGALK
jgi:hypothetical protein